MMLAACGGLTVGRLELRVEQRLREGPPVLVLSRPSSPP